MMMGCSPLGRTSTHDVFPPYRLVDRPGTGMEPRTPQNLTFIGVPGLNVPPQQARSLENLAGIEQDRYRAVVDQLDLHIPREFAGLDARHAGAADLRKRLLVEPARGDRLESARERRAPPRASVAVERELRDDQHITGDVAHGAVHLALVVREDPQVHDLVDDV